MRSGGPNLTERVVLIVARETGVDPLELPTLYSALDGNTLEELVEELDGDEQLVFDYAGKRITVTAGGSIEITDATAGASGNVDTVPRKKGD